MGSKSIIDILLWILGMLFNLVLVLIVAYVVYIFAMRGFAFGGSLAEDLLYLGEEMDIEFIITEPTLAADIALELEELGIISSSLLYRLELFLLGRVRTYYPGTFILSPSMTNTEVHRILGAQPPAEVPHLVIMIPEGWTIADMAAYFEYREFFSAEDFIYYADNGIFNFSFLNDVPQRPNRLQGYLFPDTYWVSLNPTPREIILNMLRQFENIFTAVYLEQAEDMGYTMDDIIIMASIIERETRLANERPLVSQVIHNRLDIGMRLEMCSTVSYVLDVRRDRLTYTDLEVDSPFNTYRHHGLPLGPIANPGRASILAALNPEEGDYLFFVLMNPATGEHFFSTNFETHQAAAARYNQRP